LQVSVKAEQEREQNMLLTKEEFKKLIKKSVSCLVRGIEARYKLKDGTIVVNYGGICYIEEK